MSNPVLRVDGLAKKYSRDWRSAMAYGVRDILAQLLPHRERPTRLRPNEFWALDDVSFALHAGESLAIVGGNGAGKSTLLRLLYGLIKPDRGEVRIRGRVGAIIELGTGFNPVLTGRENILLGAAMHNLRGARERQFVDEVIDFSELESFIDMPLQSYSSGMKARLAYALHALLAPDLLLVDEVLAVGDRDFQRKCVNHMRRYLEQGGALLLVSHNTFQIQSTCERGVVLRRGRAVFQGTAVEALSQHMHSHSGSEPSTPVRSEAQGPIAIRELIAESGSGGAVTDKPLRLKLRYHSRERIAVLWGFNIWTQDHWVCIAGSFDDQGRILEAGDGELECVIPRLPLLPGRYVIGVALADHKTLQSLAHYGWNPTWPHS